MDLDRAKQLAIEYFDCEKKNIKCLDITLFKVENNKHVSKRFTLRVGFTDAEFCEFMENYHNYGDFYAWDGTIWLNNSNWITFENIEGFTTQFYHELPKIPNELL